MSKLDANHKTLAEELHALTLRQKENLLQFVYELMATNPEFVARLRQGLKAIKGNDKEVK